MNKFFSSHIKTPYATDTEEYQLIIEAMNKFRHFDSVDIFKTVNKKLPRGAKLDRNKLNDTLRVLLRLKLISYRYRRVEGKQTPEIFLTLNK